MLALLGVVGDSGEPVGTRTAATALRQQFDTRLSESTVSRLLQEMDRRGWTTPLATKGRVLTPEGRARREKLLISTQASDTLSTAVSVYTVAGLLELLHARKAVESAVAADAARHAAPADIEELENLTQAQADVLAGGSVHGRPGLALHRKIADMATNAMLKVLCGVVLAPQLDHVDVVMDIILSEHHHEMSVVDHHRAVVRAIEAGDPDAAEAAMNRHFTEMIGEAEKYLVGRNASVVAKLLQFMESHPGSSPARGAS